MGETSLWSKLQELLGCFGPTDLGLLGLTISPFGAGCERARAPLGSAPGEGSQPSGACFVLSIGFLFSPFILRCPNFFTLLIFASSYCIACIFATHLKSFLEQGGSEKKIELSVIFCHHYCKAATDDQNITLPGRMWLLVIKTGSGQRGDKWLGQRRQKGA